MPCRASSRSLPDARKVGGGGHPGHSRLSSRWSQSFATRNSLLLVVSEMPRLSATLFVLGPEEVVQLADTDLARVDRGETFEGSVEGRVVRALVVRQLESLLQGTIATSLPRLTVCRALP